MIGFIILLEVLFLCASYAESTHDPEVCSSTAGQEECVDKVDKAQRLRVEGQLAFENREYSKAIKFYNKLIKVDKSYTSYHSRAMVHLAVNNFPKALKDLGRAIDKGPNETSSYYYRGKTKMKFGQCVEALSDFWRVLKIDLHHTLALEKVRITDQCIDLMHRAKPFEEADDCRGAEPFLEQLLEIIPYNRIYNLFQARCKMALEDYQATLKFAGNVLKGNDKDLDAILIRGKAYYHMDSIDRAMKHWKQGLSLDPEHKALKKLFKGVRKFQKKLSKAEDLKGERKYAEAIEQLDKALELNLSPKIRKTVVHERCKIGLMDRRFDSEKRITMCIDAKTLDPDPASSSGDLGKAYTMAEDWDKAKVAYSEANRKDRRNREYGEGLRNAEREIKKARRKDYYKILDIPKNASERQIKKAFRKCGIDHHPDKCSTEECSDKFKLCVEASDILSDKEVRRRYDAGEDVLGDQQGTNRRGPFGGGFPFGPGFRFRSRR